MDLSVTYQVIQVAVTRAVQEVNPLLPDEEKHRKGGYLCLSDRQFPWPPLFITGIGELLLSAPERGLYYNQCQERVKHLIHITFPKHVSGRMGMVPSSAKRDGGIKTDFYLMAFAGLYPDMANEAVVLLAARRLGLLSRKKADAIAKASSNSFFLGREWPITGGP